LTLLERWDEPVPTPRAHPSAAAVVRLPLLDELLLVWPHVARLLHRATVRTGCYEPIDLLRMAMAGQVGIWVCEVDGKIAAVLVSEVKQYPRRRILEMLFAGGDRMREWISAAVAALDAHGRACGCSHVSTIGRPGWARAWGGEATGDIVVVRGLNG